MSIYVEVYFSFLDMMKIIFNILQKRQPFCMLKLSKLSLLLSQLVCVCFGFLLPFLFRYNYWHEKKM